MSAVLDDDADFLPVPGATLRDESCERQKRGGALIEMVSNLSTQKSHDTTPQTQSPSPTLENRSCEEDNIGGNNTNTHINSSSNGTGDDLAWKIIQVVLKGWFIIWIFFAILVISAEMMSPSHSTTKKVKVDKAKSILFLEISEEVVSLCSYSHLDTEDGREKCQELCHDHMCCFVDEEERYSRYGCADDPKKMCAVYAGCESLVISEEDVISDANGAYSKDDSDGNTTSSNQSASPGLSQTSNQNTTLDATNATSSSEQQLQLIQQVVTSVCSRENLHTRRGIIECASICNTSMCCFDRNEIGPKMDLILKMESIGDEILNRTMMGTCMNEEEDGDPVRMNHFCRAHEGCKQILHFGTPSSTTKKSDQTSDQQRMLVTVCILFFGLIGISMYLLIFKRESAVDLLVDGAHEEEKIEFGLIDTAA